MKGYTKIYRVSIFQHLIPIDLLLRKVKEKNCKLFNFVEYFEK